jgi:hypothetical protein
MAIRVIPLEPVPPEEKPAFHKHSCPPTFGGSNPDPVPPTVDLARNLLVDFDLAIPDGRTRGRSTPRCARRSPWPRRAPEAGSNPVRRSGCSMGTRRRSRRQSLHTARRSAAGSSPNEKVRGRAAELQGNRAGRDGPPLVSPFRGQILFQEA